MTWDAAVLISSCDRYRDVWAPFFQLFFRYWPDCPYPVFLISNEEKFDHPRVTSITVGSDRDWSTSFLQAVNSLDCRWLLVMMEDYLFSRPVDSERVEELRSYAAEREAAYLRLFPVPGPDRPVVDRNDLGSIDKSSLHRASLQAAWWRREVLKRLVSPGESAWEFEELGSVRSSLVEDTFLSVASRHDSPLTYFCTGVIRGKWVPEAIAFLKDEGIEVDLSTRPVESRQAVFRRQAKYRIDELLWKYLLRHRRRNRFLRELE